MSRTGRGLNDGRLLPIDTLQKRYATYEQYEATTSFPESHLLPAPSVTVSNPPETSSQPVPLVIADANTANAELKPNSRKKESRKLLAHVLEQLRNRSLPPTVFDIVLGDHKFPGDPSVASTVFKGAATPAVLNSVTHASSTTAEEDEEDEEYRRDFSTDATYELMTRLKDVLSLPALNGWQIFDDRASQPRRSPNTLSPSRHKGRSPSPHSREHALELLSACISIISSVVREDCRFKIASVRPSQPPYALQAITIEIARFLLYACRNDFTAISLIASAMIPAFLTFPKEMHTRLLIFFLYDVFRGNSDNLAAPPLPVNFYQDDSTPFQTLQRQGPNIVSITVDEPTKDPSFNDFGASWTPWSTNSTVSSVPQYSSAFRSSQIIDNLSSIVPPLLAAIFENVDSAFEIHPDNLFVGHYFRGLASFLHTNNPSFYLDIMDIIAFQSEKARRRAVPILLSLYPLAVGHLTLSKYPTPDAAQHHRFIPWNFMDGQYSGLSNICRACAGVIRGFGVLCTFCLCAVHFDCFEYPRGNHLFNYSMTADSRAGRVALFRFSDSHITSQTPLGHHHRFVPVNLLTLCLCFVCHKPLWGPVFQGMRCSSCSLFAHHSCAPIDALCGPLEVNSTHLTVVRADLRRSFLDFYASILSSLHKVENHGYEDVVLIRDILWLQLRLLENGIALGSIVVVQDPGSPRSIDHYVDEFELHTMLHLCSQTAEKLNPSSFMLQSFLREAIPKPESYSIVFDWSSLVFIAAATKRHIQDDTISPIYVSGSGVNPDVPPHFPEIGGIRDSSHLIPLSRIRNALGHEFSVFIDDGARFLLQLMLQAGLFERFDHQAPLANELQPDLLCSFTIPFAIDQYSDVEILFASMGACLSDVDLSVNETGFLLLRRMWPNPILSKHALKRLTVLIATWLFDEDTALAVVLRDYVGQRQQLPGVRSVQDGLSWPTSKASRSMQGNSSSNSGEYLAIRRAIFTRYALPWLKALHDLDTVNYPLLLYDCCSVTSNGLSDKYSGGVPVEEKHSVVDYFDTLLKNLTRLFQTNSFFDTFDIAFVRWLHDIVGTEAHTKPMTSLYRLCNREGDISYRQSTLELTQQLHSESLSAFDPWRLLVTGASQSKDGLLQSLQWFSVFVRCGLEIPLPSLMRYSNLCTQFKLSFMETQPLITSLLMYTWLKSTGRYQLQTVIASSHSRLFPELLSCIKSGTKISEAITFIRQSLAVCLLLYGCSRQLIQEAGMVASDVEGLASRRKVYGRGSVDIDPVVIEPWIINALDLYIGVEVDEISYLITSFLSCFLMHCPYLQQHEVDNFIVRNGRLLCRCAWDAYGIQRSDIIDIRGTFLLRVLVVDTLFFKELLDQRLSGDWEHRLIAIIRLFRIILDINNPAFYLDGRQWQSSIVDILYRGFRMIWCDEKEEVRLATETFLSSLLPAHFDSLSKCWTEHLEKSPVNEKLELVSFLVHLRPHFPHWQVLSWDAIVTCLDEDLAYNLPQHDRLHLPGGHLTDYSDSNSLQIPLLDLSLGMIADGIHIDLATQMRIKSHLVRALGFQDVTAQSGLGNLDVEWSDAPIASSRPLPCLSAIIRVLDAPYLLDTTFLGLGPPGQIGDAPPLVGSAYINLCLRLFSAIQDIENLPVMSLKHLLESLIIIIYKHDFDQPFLHNQHQNLRKAVGRTVDLFGQDINYECHQLSLSALQAYVSRWPGSSGQLILTSIEPLTSLITSQHHHTQDSLVIRAKAFLDSTLRLFANSSLFISLIKRSLNSQFFVILKDVAHTKRPAFEESLEALFLRSTLSRIQDIDKTSFHTVLNNLEAFIDTVYHQNFAADLLIFVGQSLANIARRSVEWTPDVLDPSPILRISATLIRHNKSQCRDFLPYADTCLRTLLSRSIISTQAISSLLQASNVVFRRQETNEARQANTILSSTFEILGDALRLKNRVQPPTVQGMIEALEERNSSNTSIALINIHQYMALAEPAYYFLQNSAWTSGASEYDFNLSTTVAKTLLRLISRDPSLMTKIIQSSMVEANPLASTLTVDLAFRQRPSRQNMTIRAWNILILCSLLSPEHWDSMLMNQIQAFGTLHRSALALYTSGQWNLYSETMVLDVNHAYVAIKLWLMLAHKIALREGGSNALAVTVWNELWHPFESLINLLEQEEQKGASLSMTTWTSSTIADLFLFVHTLRCPVGMQSESHISLLRRLKAVARGDAHSGKLTRTIRSLAEPPAEIPFDTLVQQSAKDLVAAEKLRILDGKREAVPPKVGR